MDKEFGTNILHFSVNLYDEIANIGGFSKTISQKLGEIHSKNRLQEEKQHKRNITDNNNVSNLPKSEV